MADIESLNKYQWCGHAVLMGMRTFKGMVTEEVLTRFGDSNSIARSSYLNFINDGISQGQKPELGRRRRNKQVVKARDVFCYIAVRILSHSGTKAGQFMNIKRSAVSHAVGRGRQIVAENPNLVEKIIQPPC